MVKGKYAEKSVQKTIDRLQNDLQKAKEVVDESKKELAKTRKELSRLRAMENVFLENVDVLRELKETEKKLQSMTTENIALQKKVTDYLDVFDKNDFKVTHDVLADMTEAGLLADVFTDNREHKRNAKSGTALKKAFNRYNTAQQINKSRSTHLKGS